MARLLVAAMVLLAASVSPVSAGAAEAAGKVLYDRYCASCHPGGGNVIKPDRDLMGLTRQAAGIRSAQDVVARMRHPSGPRMPRFDKAYLSDQDALKIGEYVVSTFK